MPVKSYLTISNQDKWCDVGFQVVMEHCEYILYNRVNLTFFTLFSKISLKKESMDSYKIGKASSINKNQTQMNLNCNRDWHSFSHSFRCEEMVK